MRLVSIFRFSALLIAACLTTAVQSNPTMAQQTQSVSAAHVNLPSGFNDVFTHRFAETNGVRLHYVIGGPTDGPMVILLHGWPQTWYTWRSVMPALARAGYRVVAVDYRGAGDSEKPQGGYDKATMAADIHALAHELGASRIDLVGRDIGVMVAYAYAAQWPMISPGLPCSMSQCRERIFGMTP